MSRSNHPIQTRLDGNLYDEERDHRKLSGLGGKGDMEGVRGGERI